MLDAIDSIKVRQIGRMTRGYLNTGFSGDRLLHAMGLNILKDDTGWRILNPLRTVFDEWQTNADHPARNQLLIGLARYATDSRKHNSSHAAAMTAQRFARGQTAVDLYES